MCCIIQMSKILFSKKVQKNMYDVIQLCVSLYIYTINCIQIARRLLKKLLIEVTFVEMEYWWGRWEYLLVTLYLVFCLNFFPFWHVFTFKLKMGGGQNTMVLIDHWLLEPSLRLDSLVWGRVPLTWRKKCFLISQGAELERMSTDSKETDVSSLWGKLSSNYR